jgi:hypothetical protein
MSYKHDIESGTYFKLCDPCRMNGRQTVISVEINPECDGFHACDERIKKLKDAGIIEEVSDGR